MATTSTRGVGYTKHLDETLRKGVYESPIPNWAFLYEVSSTRNPDYNIGNKVVLPDGREFHYGKSSGECASGQACEFVATGVQAYSTAVAGSAIGDTTVTITGQTHDELAKDVLRGGYMINWPAAKKDQIRGIVGNDLSLSAANITIYLDGPLQTALGVTGVELFENPFASLRTGSDAALPKAGVPAAYVSASGKYFWVQTKGFGWAAPQSDVKDNGGVGVCWRHDGSLQSAEIVYAATTPATDTSQYAGNRVIGAANGRGPLIMLK